MLISTSPLISTATLTNYFGSQSNGTNLTCSSTTSSALPPTKTEYAVLMLKGNGNTMFIWLVNEHASVSVHERKREREVEKEGERKKA